MYPEELSCSVPQHLPREEQLKIAICHAAREELADALRMIEHCLAQLSVEQIWWRADESLNSIGNLVLHLAGNLRQWLIVGLGGGSDQRDRPSEFAERGPLDHEVLRSTITACVGEASLVLATISDEDLLRVRRIQGFEVTGMAALWHTVSHFRGHTQEIIGLTRRQLGPSYRFAWTPQTPDQGSAGQPG